MAKRKSRFKFLLISSPKGMDSLQPIFDTIFRSFDNDLQIDLNVFFENNFSNARQREKDIIADLSSNDLIIVDIANTSPYTYFEIGVARTIGKPVLFLVEAIFLEQLPDFIRKSLFVYYKKREDLSGYLKSFFIEFVENPKRFIPTRLLSSDSNTQIVVDLDKLEPRVFENLCFELLSRLGYKQLEWKFKDEFVDAVTTLRKKDPDGFEYEEFWLVSFKNDSMKNEMFEIAIHEPEYFVERIYRNISSDFMSRSKNFSSDVPITLLFIVRGKDGEPKRLVKEYSRRDFIMNRRGLTFRIRWWDDQVITNLVQNNITLARKYFSSEALARSNVRLTYEELYKENIEVNEELERTNELLLYERSRIESLERDAAWKLLSFTAAHRLGNPLDAIDSELSNLKQALSLKRDDMFEEIISSMEIPIERAKSIVSEFRNLSIAHEINPEIVNSVKLNSLLKYAAKKAKDRKVKVALDLQKVPNIAIDIQKLSDCFGEIVSNSLHFVTEKKHILSISSRLVSKKELPESIDRTKNYLKITFTDNGCGIPNEKKKEIFKPFERSYVHGTGLGLAFCESIIEKHHGIIREIGKPGEGAIFEIFLPVINNKK